VDQLTAFLTGPTGQTFAALVVLFLALLLVDGIGGRSSRRYLSAGFRTDLVYTLLVVGSVYGLIQQPILNAVDGLLRRWTPFLYLHLLDALAETPRFLVFIAVVDLIRYWRHRWMHSSRFLWAFHSVHHVSEQLTFLTTYRLHLVEVVLDGLVTLGPVVLLGAPAPTWITVNALLVGYSALQHSDLDWGWGRLEGVFVSPRYHSVHHSSDARDYNRNFASALAIWDVLFGTAERGRGRPVAYGVPGLDVRPSFIREFWLPFRLLATQPGRVRTRISPPADALARRLSAALPSGARWRRQAPR
jgi:sterol desaturase/sphingolipid hydroxylase (fatty acid hydroxylase superfamily)